MESVVEWGLQERGGSPWVVVVGGMSWGLGWPLKKNRLRFASAANSSFRMSLSVLCSLNRFRRRNRLPFSNMSKACGCSAQYAPLPALSGRRGTFMKQSLKLRLCRREFCGD